MLSKKFTRIIFHNKFHPANNIDVITKFRNRFKCYTCENFNEIDNILKNENIPYFYNICGGNKNSTELVKNSVNLIHAVFTIEPFGDIYAGVSSYIVNKSEFKTTPSIPHIVDLPISSENMRNDLNISANSIVIGCYGGKEQFDMIIAHNAIKTILEKDDNMYFIFANTNVFYIHPRIIYLDTIIDTVKKVCFINTCDAMIHARSDGETFGLAVAEFSICNKPIITSISNVDNCHIDILKDKAIIYNSEEHLVDIFSNIRTIIKSREDWNAYQEYTPEKVMKKFYEVFLEKDIKDK